MDKIEDIKDRLGWYNHPGNAETAFLIKICMELCDHIKALEVSGNQVSNKVSMLANGITPD